MEKEQFDKISEIVAGEGYVEWALICFTPQRDYNIFSYFTDPGVMPIFRVVLFSILKRLDQYCLSNEKNKDIGNC